MAFHLKHVRDTQYYRKYLGMAITQVGSRRVARHVFAHTTYVELTIVIGEAFQSKQPKKK